MVEYAIAFGMTTAALVRPATTSSLNQSLSYSETHFGSIEQRRGWWLPGKSMLSTLLAADDCAFDSELPDRRHRASAPKAAAQRAHGHDPAHYGSVSPGVRGTAFTLLQSTARIVLTRGRTLGGSAAF